MTKAQFVEWVSENNIPTTIGGQLGVDLNGTAGAGIAASVEGGWLFNWWSGELVYQGTGAVGLIASPAASVGIGIHGGVTSVAGASTVRDSIIGYSRYQSVSVQADTIAKVGLSVTTAKSVPANQSNPNILLVSQMAGTYIDPVFDRSVDTLALNTTFGLDPLPNGVDASYSKGFSKTVPAFSFNLYAPFVNFYNQWLH